MNSSRRLLVCACLGHPTFAFLTQVESEVAMAMDRQHDLLGMHADFVRHMRPPGLGHAKLNRRGKPPGHGRG